MSLLGTHVKLKLCKSVTLFTFFAPKKTFRKDFLTLVVFEVGIPKFYGFKAGLDPKPKRKNEIGSSQEISFIVFMEKGWHGSIVLQLSCQRGWKSWCCLLLAPSL